MKKDIIYKLLMIFCFVVWNIGCSEYEMQKFPEAPAVNFMGIDSDGSHWDEPETLNLSVNFGTEMNNFGAQYDTLRIGVKLEGRLSSKPLRVVLKAIPVDGSPILKLIIPTDSYIPADTNATAIKVLVNRQILLDTLYQVNLGFDYAKSDVKAGTIERQKFSLNIKDQLTFKMLNIAQVDWDEYYYFKVGDFGEMKLRLMLSVLKTFNFYNGFSKAKFQLVRDALQAYNDAHPGNPLKEANGDIVNCDPKK